MDTPEMHQAPAGRQARDTLATLIPVGTTVALELDVDPTDRYDRVLAYVWRDGILVNWWLVRNGWARVLTVPPNVRYVDPLVEAQRTARFEGRGLWGTGALTCRTGDPGC
jgi:micrococcal nuclease